MDNIKFSNQIQSVILISDIHFGVRNANLEWVDNITSYMDNFFIPLLNNIKNERPNSIVIVAGDYFDNRQSLDLNVMNIGFTIMEKISSIFPVYIITGNHDVYKKNDNSINSLRIFQLINNVHVITEETILDFDRMKFLLLPWSGDIKGNMDALMQYPADYAIMHEEIKSLVYDNGRPIVNGIDANYFKGTKIYSGHIHKRQVTDKVTYIGAPYQLRRSDMNNDRGIYVLDVDGDKLVEHFYKNDFSPKFLRIRIEDLLDIKVPQLKSIINNNYVDIVIKSTVSGNINLPALMSVMDQCGPKKIEIIPDNSGIEEVISDCDVLTTNLTVGDIIKTKIEKMDITEDQKKKILDLNVKYLSAYEESLNN